MTYTIMNNLNRFAFLPLLFLVLSSNVSAQKTGKGNSSANPWNKEIDDGEKLFKGKNDPYEMFSELKFGEWSFKADYPHAQTYGETSNADPGWFRNMDVICCEPYSSRSARYYTNDSIHVFAGAPGKLNFQMYFSFTDSVFEQYRIRWFKYDYDMVMHFYRKMQGKVKISDRETFSFNLGVYYSDSIAQPLSYIYSGTDTIFLKPVFDPKIKDLQKVRSSGSSYAGFEFVQHDQLIGGAQRSLDFADDVRYKYWISPALEIKDQEAVAAIIFALVGFIK
jgi:hypothetical protein